MKALSPYLNFKGTTEEAFNFYKSVFGGEFVMLQRFKETPNAASMPPEAQDKLMHVSLPILPGVMLMGTDGSDTWGPKIEAGSSISLAIEAESTEEADKLFNGLSAGGTVTQPMAGSSWGAYFGMFTDKFGINWMINYQKPKA